MKAQARKILALVMAFAMCLSLAAPAFAFDTGNVWADDAGIDTTGKATDTDFKAEAKKDVAVNVVAVGEVGKGGYEVQGVKKGNEYTATYTDLYGDGYFDWYLVAADDVTLIAGNVTNTTQPNGVEVKKLTNASHLIGQGEVAATYEVKYSAARNNDRAVVQVGKNSQVKATLADSNVTWTALTGADMTFAVGNQQYQVKGSYYKETDPTTGKVNVFFKLAAVDASKNFTTDEHYFAAKEMNTSDSLSAALRKAATGKEVDIYGEDKTGTTVALIPGASIEVKSIEQVDAAYNFVVQNQKDLAVTTSAGAKGVVATKTKPTAGKFTGITFATDTDTKKQKTTGSFQVSIEDLAQEYRNASATNDTNAVYVTDAAAAKTILVDALSGLVTVNDVTAAGGNFLNVTVTALANAEPYKSSGYSKNILVYGTKAGLIDQSKDGWYNGDNPEGRNGSAIAAGTEFLGPVAVRENDVTAYNPQNGTVTNGYRVYESVKAMKDDIKTTDCKNSKTISYAQAILNYKVGGNANVLLQSNANLEGAIAKEGQYANTVAVDLKSDWATLAFTPSAAAFVKTGTYDVAATSHQGPIVETVETKNATCKEKGTKTTKSVCTHCNQVVSEKTEEVPVVTNPVKTNTTAKVKDANGKDVDQVFFADAAAAGNVEHYIAKAETTTTTDPTTKVTTVTTVYTCNLGVVHDELTRVVTVEKADLQHSGKWNLATWTENPNILNQTGGVASGATARNMWGNILEIADSDVDNENLPLNRKSEANDKPFTINAVTNAMDDGTYTQVYTQTVDVFANSKALPKQKTYLAVATVKNIKYAKAECLTGTASVQVDVYEQTEKYDGNTDFITTAKGSTKLDAERLAKALTNGKLTKIQTITKDVVIPASATHYYSAGSTVCDRCGTSRESADNKAQIITADTITVEDVTYTGKPVLPKVVVKDTAGNILIKGIDYEIGYEDENATAVGEYFVVVKGIGDYVGNRIAKTYKIVAASTTAKKQTLKVNTKKKTFKVKNLKKKKASFKVKLSGAKTAVTWKSNNAKVTVKGSKTKATITVKKGTKKGTYKVTATAKKTSAYKKGTVTVKVIVK